MIMGHISRKKVICIAAGFLFTALACLCIGMALFLTHPAERGGQAQTLVVKEGWTLREVAQELKSKDIISNKTLFMLWARVKGYGRSLRAGEYDLSASMPPLRILEKLTRGEIITHAVTIPEGFTMKQIGDLLGQKGIVDKQAFLDLTDSKEIVEEYGFSSPTLEGYLYPDTYQFGRRISPRMAVDTMVRRFREIVEPLEERMKEVNMSIEQVTTLASIVEKETGQGKERPLIASVFLNRLRKRMRLASDPTVIYGIKNFNGNLTRKDLEEKTPYNTYVNYGLPPGPIASPGFASIKAVLYPADTNYLYFVSKNDGSHHFSKTLIEHNRAVQTYQKKRRSRR